MLSPRPVEWVVALCTPPQTMLPSNVFDFDFDDEAGDGSLCERFASVLRIDLESTAESQAAQGSGIVPLHGRRAHWLHECIAESKLDVYPYYLLMHLQIPHKVGNEPAFTRTRG